MVLAANRKEPTELAMEKFRTLGLFLESGAGSRTFEEVLRVGNLTLAEASPVAVETVQPGELVLLGELVWVLELVVGHSSRLAAKMVKTVVAKSVSGIVEEPAVGLSAEPRRRTVRKTGCSQVLDPRHLDCALGFAVESTAAP